MKRKLNIGFVWDGNYPWDIRVEKMCLRLIDDGHEVHMVCRNTKEQPREEVIDRIHIHRLPCLKFFPRLNQAINFPFFFNPVWYMNISRLFSRHRIDIAIVRDITLSLTTLYAARKHRVPVILDMAEPYPELIKAQHTYENMGILKKIFRNVSFAEWVEEKTLDGVATVYAMVEESRDRMLEMGVPESKIKIVSNTPDLKRFKNGQSRYPGLMAELKNKTVMLYVGFVHHHRGLRVAIEGMKHIFEKSDAVVLVIIGSGEAIEDLKGLARSLGVEGNIIFAGHQNHALVPDFISSADIGIITHFSCGLWDNTIPNKLFDYMSMGKAVLCSNAKPVKRIVEDEWCGLVYNDTDPKDFAAQALRLLDPALRKTLGENGLRAVKERYNWSIDSNRMIKHINELSSSLVI